jgi:hypothetical protein
MSSCLLPDVFSRFHVHNAFFPATASRAGRLCFLGYGWQKRIGDDVLSWDRWVLFIRCSQPTATWVRELKFPHEYSIPWIAGCNAVFSFSFKNSRSSMVTDDWWIFVPTVQRRPPLCLEVKYFPRPPQKNSTWEIMFVLDRQCNG